MQYVGNLFSTVTEFYKELNPSTLSGAIDVIVVKQAEGTLACSPFHVRFGKLQLLRPHEKAVEVRVNSKLLEYHMKLGEAGEAFFVFESENPVPSEFATSPLILAQDSDSEALEYFSLDTASEVESNKVFTDSPTHKKETLIVDPLIKRESFHVGRHYSNDDIVSNAVYKEGNETLILDKKGYNVSTNKKKTLVGFHHNLSDTDLGELSKPSTPTLREVKSDNETGVFSSDESHDGFSDSPDGPFSDSEYDVSKGDKTSEARANSGYRKWTAWFSSSSPSLTVPKDETKPAPIDTERTRLQAKLQTGSFESTRVSESPIANSAAKKQNNYAKTLRLTSEQLSTIGLVPGVNSVDFTVGKATCSARIFLWNHNEKVVISDIDGTITKSDALGHIFTMVGKDWTHPGVAKLYTDINRNGYQILYLTSRAIGQADTTREYLRNIDQSHNQLPDGPVIMSPDRLFQSLHREVVLRKPHLFKTACLKDVLSLFGGRSPFYAGFGNRITDAMSYRSVNVPISRIFTIDYNGDIQHELIQSYNSSYVKLSDMVDQIFPSTTTEMISEFNDWNFWKNSFENFELPTDILPANSVDSKSTPPEKPSVVVSSDSDSDSSYSDEDFEEEEL